MNLALLLLATGLAFALFAAASGSETGIYSARRIRAAIRAGRGDRFAARLSPALLDPVPILVTILVLQNLLHYATTLLGEVTLGLLEVPHPNLWNWIVLTPAIIVFGDSLPKLFFRQRPEGALRLTFRPILWIHRLLLPFGAALRAVGTAVTRGLSRGGEGRSGPLWSREGLEELIFEGAEAGTLSHLQRSMAVRVLRYSRTPVRHVATSLGEVLLVPEDMERVAFLRKATARGAREAFLYRESPGRPERELRVLDLLFAPPSVPLAEVSKPLARVPGDLPVDRAIPRLQRQRARVGLVVDRREEPVGIVTLRSLVRHVVGEVETAAPSPGGRDQGGRPSRGGR